MSGGLRKTYIIYQICLYVLAGSLMLVPYFALGQQNGGLVPCRGIECQACHAIALVQNVLNFFVTIASGLAILLFSYAGFLMLTAAGNTGKIEKGKGVFVNVLIGIVIVLAAWLIIDTIMKAMFEGSALSGTQGFGGWNEIICVQPVISGNVDIGQPQIPGQGGTQTPTQPGQVSPGQYTQAEAEAALAAASIAVRSSGNCSDQNNNRCTSLQGMRQDTINQLLEIRRACPDCGIAVTGGTETGHAVGSVSHGSGHKVDISSTFDPDLNAFLESRLARDGTRGGANGGPRYRDSCGNEYVRESSHWDISITNGKCSL
jgi:hypothetical protein